MLSRLCILLVLSCLCINSAKADVVTVDVVILEHDDLPALSEKEIESTLALAATMMRKALDREVKWSIIERKGYDRFLADQRNLTQPYSLPSFDIFTGKPTAHRDAVIKACREYGSLEQIKAMLPEEARAKVKHEGDAADELIKIYTAAIEVIKEVKTKSGRLMVTPKNRQDFSIIEFEVMFQAMDLPKKPTLYLSNTMIVDDNLASPAPHTMLRGIAHGVAFPAAERALVGYQVHLMGDPRLTGYPWKLSDGGKRAAIAYTIAHEVGTHLLLKERDDFDRQSLVSRPMPITEDNLLKVDQWTTRKKAGKTLDMTALQYSRFYIRMSVAIARNEKKKAEVELNALVDLDCPDDWKLYAEEVYQKAKWK